MNWIMTTAMDGKATWRTRSSAVVPWVTLGIGILISLVLYVVIRDNVERAAEERFHHQVIEAKQIIERRILSYAEVLYGARALFASNNPVSRVQFHRFVESLNLKSRFPGFDSVNYAAYVRADDKRRFVEAVRRDASLEAQGYPQFTIKPPGERPEYYVLVYIEPMADFKFVFGLDIGANPAMGVNQHAMAAVQQSGRDSGKLIASGLPIPIKTATKEYTGLAMRLPVYRNGVPLDTVEQRRAAYIGSVGAGFNVENLMTGVLDEKTTRYMRFKVYGPVVDRPASSSASKEQLLFDSKELIQRSSAQSAADDPSSTFIRVLPMEIAGRIWRIQFSASKDTIISLADSLLPSTVFAGGVLSTLLLFAVLHSLSSSRSRALKLAAQMTKDLRETEERFRLIAENASDLIALIDPQGRRVYVNPAYGRLFGDYKGLVGTDAFQEMHPEDKEQARKAFFDTVQDGQNRHVEFRFLLPSGEIRWISSHRSAVFDSHGRIAHVVAVARDVTEQRRTEEALQARDVQLQEAQALANLGSWEWDVRTKTGRWSDQLIRIFGLRHDQVPSNFDGFYKLVHPEDRERTARIANEALRGGVDYESQFRIVRPDGVVRTVHNQARVDRDGAVRP